MVVSIPIVDISSIGLESAEPSTEQFRSVGNQLDAAFREIGFVYLSNHGISKETILQGMETSKQFFLQDEKTKTKYKREINTGEISGWVAKGRETFEQEDGKCPTLEIRESFDIFRMDDSAKIPETGDAECRRVFKSLSLDSIHLANRLLKSLSLALGKEIDFFEKKHRRMLDEGNKTSMRTLYYPPIEGEIPPGSIRCGEHTDYGTFTLLYQDQYPGLEVKSSQSEWISAPPIPGNLMVNIGDLLEIWTQKSYPATVHRVIIPKEELEKKSARQSIVFFVHPDDEVLITPLTGERTAADCTDITALEHVSKRFAETFKY